MDHAFHNVLDVRGEAHRRAGPPARADKIEVRGWKAGLQIGGEAPEASQIRGRIRGRGGKLLINRGRTGPQQKVVLLAVDDPAFGVPARVHDAVAARKENQHIAGRAFPRAVQHIRNRHAGAGGGLQRLRQTLRARQSAG